MGVEVVGRGSARRRTKTSAFGCSGRNGHDSSGYYSLAMAEGHATVSPVKSHNGTPVEAQLPKEFLDKIITADVAKLPPNKKLPDNSVHLMVTSPPYCVGKEYDEDLTPAQYRDLMRTVWRETHRVLVHGGRACINIANIGRKPYVPLHAEIIGDMQDIGFLMRGEIIWNKAASSGSSTAWGSWMSPSNPCLRDEHEYILIFSKGAYQRPQPQGKRKTISKEAFIEYTRSIWSMKAESAKRIGHPAPYPLELPKRCVQLYTYSDDVVFDPFMGSGTTAVAAVESSRHFVGYEIIAKYSQAARKRITQANKQMALL